MGAVVSVLRAADAPAEGGPEEGEPHDSTGAELMESALEDLELAKQHLTALEEKARLLSLAPCMKAWHAQTHRASAHSAFRLLRSFKCVLWQGLVVKRLHNNPRPQQQVTWIPAIRFSGRPSAAE